MVGAVSKAVIQYGILRLGLSNEGVRIAQHALRDAGYNLKGTGYFGAATDTAVEALQRRTGAKEVDGRIGHETAALIDRLSTSVTNNLVIQKAPIAEISRPLWVEAGVSLINTIEKAGSGDNQTILDWAREEGGSIAKSYNHDSIPWCALFINHILTRASLKGTETLWALDFEGRWPSVRLAGPAVGAIAPMKRDGGGHVICVVGKDQHGNVMGLGGNQSDKVSIIPFPAARLNRGFWWPEAVVPPVLVGINNLPLIRSDGRLSSKEA